MYLNFPVPPVAKVSFVDVYGSSTLFFHAPSGDVILSVNNITAEVLRSLHAAVEEALAKLARRGER